MLNATVVERQNITDDLIILKIKPDAGISDFAPGQYVAIGLSGGAERPSHFPAELEAPNPEKLIKRAYSIGSPSHNKDYIEFYIAIVPTGALTSRLALIKEGDRLHVAPKITGTFTLHDVPPNENLVLIATGTGLAPYMAMIRTPSTWTEGRTISIVHGVRYATDLAYRDELLALAESNPNFKYYSVVSRPDDSRTGERGYVQGLFDRGLITLSPERDHVFVCGNPAMIDDIEKRLTANGYVVHSKKTPGRLHLEKYW